MTATAPSSSATEPPLTRLERLRRVGILCLNKREYEVGMPFHRRGAAATRLGCAACGLLKTLYPFDRSTGDNLEVFGGLASRSASLNVGSDLLADICRVGLRRFLP